MPPAKKIQGLTAKEIKKNKEQLAKLLSIPLVPQKSKEWYSMRDNMITASDFAQALGHGKFGSQNDLIKKKCVPTEWKSGTNMFFKWGNMFEPVACQLYSLMHNNIKIHEFGLLQHPDLSFFGASPDGISDIGIMVEIKCPFKRKIIPGGEVPKQYFYQIQGQLEVCGLDHCDYFECEFEKVSAHDLDDDINKNRWRGVLIDYGEDEFGEVAYSEIIAPGNDKSADKLCEWVDHELKSRDNGTIIYWSLAVYNEVRVTKDGVWVKEKLNELAEVWKKILYYRENPNLISMELDRTLSIDTEEAFPDKKKTTKHREASTPVAKSYGTALTGYAFRDVEDDDSHFF